MQSDVGIDRDILSVLHALVESEGWRVLVADLKLRYVRLDRSLKMPSDTATLADVRVLQGALEEIKRLLERPERMIAEIRGRIGQST